VPDELADHDHDEAGHDDDATRDADHDAPARNHGDHVHHDASCALGTRSPAAARGRLA